MPIVVDKEKKRRDILDAAMRVFAEKGFHRAKMEEIAVSANIGKGTIYEYFQSKTELFLSLHAHMLAQLREFYAKELRGLRDPRELMQRFIETAFETFRLWEPFFIVFFDFWAEGGRSEHQALLQDQLRKAQHDSRQDVASIIAAGVELGVFRCPDPTLAAANLLGSLDGLVLQWLCDRQALDLEKLRELVAQTTLKSLEP